jgi:ATP-binding cassette subfamily G (WHITE) protein 2 (SNQ2)
MECAPSQLVPQGFGADPAYQGCALAGAQVNAHEVVGSAYLQTQYNYSRSHLWRNFGVVIAFIVLYLLTTCAANETFSFVGGGGGALIFKKSRKAKQQVAEASTSDEEKGSAAVSDSSSSKKESTMDAEHLHVARR